MASLYLREVVESLADHAEEELQSAFVVTDVAVGNATSEVAGGLCQYTQAVDLVGLVRSNATNWGNGYARG